MTPDELKKLRGHFHALLGLERSLASIPVSTPGMVVDEGTYEMVASEVEQISSSFPDLIPTFRHDTFFSHDVGRGAYYHLDPLKLYVARAVGRLKTAVDDGEAVPVTEVRQFAYVSNSRLRDMVARDYLEAQRTFVAKCWKAVILLAGGLIEAVLLDLLQQNDVAARAANAAPSGVDLSRWGLSDLIEVAVELKLVSQAVEKLSHPVREYRNLIHPGVELRHAMSYGAEEARIAIEVVHILDRDLS